MLKPVASQCLLYRDVVITLVFLQTMGSAAACLTQSSAACSFEHGNRSDTKSDLWSKMLCYVLTAVWQYK